MNNQGFRDVQGVPDGWELVRIGKPEIGELFIDGMGCLSEAKHDGHWNGCAIIRKIEVPKQWRPFANAEEFKPHRDRWVTRIDKSDTVSCPGACRVLAYDESGVWWSERYETYEDAFEDGRCFDDDGTPFGVEVVDD